MIEIVSEEDIAERKPYRFSDKVLARMAKERKEKERKKKEMALSITKIDGLTEIIPEEIVYRNALSILSDS